MRKIPFFVLFFLLAMVKLAAQSGFASVTSLKPLAISISTKEKPQAKVWTYAHKWWCVLSTSAGTKLFRLDGTSWTAVLHLASATSAKADCRVVGNVVHILLFRGAANSSYLFSLEYDAANTTYKSWSQGTTPTRFKLPSGSETATLAIDETGRLWVASGGRGKVYVWWSEAPYTHFSAPITITSGIAKKDSYTITSLSGKIGILWSNQHTKRYGFRTHMDGSDPTVWTADEVPASQSAIDNIGRGMASGEMNITIASNGTLYCAAETGYNKTGYPELILLVRHPNGIWDEAHPVTVNPEGTRPLVILDEALRKLKIVYTSKKGGGDIVYRESSTSDISFGGAATLISGGSNLYDYATSTHQSYSSEIALLATNLSKSPLRAVSVLASDGALINHTSPMVSSINRQSPTANPTNATSVTYRATFSEKVSGVDAADFSLAVVNGTVSASVSSVTAVGTAGTTYDISVASIGGNGTIRLDLKASGTGITDASSNAITGGFTAGQTYTIQARNHTSPTVISVNRQSPTTQTTSATSVTYRVTFSESVSGVDVTDFNLTVVNGTVSGSISSVTMAGTNGTTYYVTVSSITGTGDLRLDLKGSGTGITDAAGNAISGGFTAGAVYALRQTTVNSAITRGPYLQMASQTAVTVRWRTDVATDSRVEAGTSFGNYTIAATNPAVTTEHEVRITGLNAGTKYFYRLGSIAQIMQGDATDYLHTAPASSSTQKIRIAVFGDCGNYSATQTKVLNAYLNYTGSTPAEMMLLLGDNAYVDGTDNEYQNNFFKPYASTVLKNHMLFTTPGNHDYHTTARDSRDAPYYKNFTMPTAAECGGVASGTEAYYSFNWGNIHFISLDSHGAENPDKTHLYDTLGPQVTWVKKDLAANSLPWVIAFWHHPPFTMGTHNSDKENDLRKIRQNFIRILERYGVDLVLCGHSHAYERSYLLRGYYGTEASFNPRIHTVSTSSGKYNGSVNSCPYTTSNGKVNHGTVYVVSGSASHSESVVDASFPHAALPFATKAGEMLYLEVERNRLDVKCIREDGVVFDQFSIMKDVNKTSNLSIVQEASVTLTASWVGEYKWSNGASTRSITVAPGADVNYTVTDGMSCLKDVFTINVASTSAMTMKAGTGTDVLSSQNRPADVYPTIVARGKDVTIHTYTNEEAEATIIDNNGGLVRSFRITGSTASVQTSELAAGMYFIIVKSKNRVDKQKFVVTNE